MDCPSLILTQPSCLTPVYAAQVTRLALNRYRHKSIVPKELTHSSRSFIDVAITETSRRPNAFTLLEMLIVLTVIGILAAFLFPAFHQAGLKARSVRCAQNLRQIGLGMEMYADADPYSRLPGNELYGRPPVGLDPNPSWIFNLNEWVGSVQRIRICPSDSLAPRRETNASSSYVLNQYTSQDQRHTAPRQHGNLNASLTDPEGNPIFIVPHIRRLDAIPNPSSTMVVFEGSDLGFLIGDERTHPDTWFQGWENVLADINPTRHGNSANYLYADWHVESLRAVKLKARIESGDNFAVPGR